MNASAHSPYEEIFAAIQKKGRLTIVRKKIVEQLGKATKPLSIQEIVSITAVDEVSVYRTIDFLKELGFVEEIATPDGMRRFALVLEHHDHIICTICGYVAHIPCFREGARVRHKAFASIHAHSLTYYGLCSQCGH